MKAALEDRANRPALARKLEREYRELAQHETGLRTELETRAIQEANVVLHQHRAAVVAEREQREEDAAALEGVEGWQREKAAEKLRESFDRRLEKRTALTADSLMAEAERRVAANLAGLGPGWEPTEIPTEEGVISSSS